MALLTVEQKNDLRQRVLRGQPLTLEEARDVIESTRQGASIAVLAGETKARKGSSKKPSLSDEQLDKDLEGLGL